MIYRKLKTILPQLNNAVIVEIGAHIGTDTLRLCQLLTMPYTYLAIEPDVRNFNRLGPICEKVNAKLLPLAIGAKNDIVSFWFSNGGNEERLFTDCNSLKKPIDCPQRPANIEFRQGSIVCSDLDWIFSIYNLKHIDLIWMDVQGAELEVFAGAKLTLHNTDYIYTECQDGRYEGQQGLKGILEVLPNWEVVLKNGENVLLKNKGSNE